MVTLYNGDRKMIVAPDEVKDFESQGWSKKKGGSSPKVEKVAEKVAVEPVGDPVLQEEEEEVVEEVKHSSKKKKGTKNRFV
tara:strand:- start:5961 stop:6203 length:243 start_codon:yes stop_codon:yes gene_type:complete